jgi:hypothetical protein
LHWIFRRGRAPRCAAKRRIALQSAAFGELDHKSTVHRTRRETGSSPDSLWLRFAHAAFYRCSAPQSAALRRTTGLLYHGILANGQVAQTVTWTFSPCLSTLGFRVSHSHPIPQARKVLYLYGRVALRAHGARNPTRFRSNGKRGCGPLHLTWLLARGVFSSPWRALS